MPVTDEDLFTDFPSPRHLEPSEADLVAAPDVEYRSDPAQTAAARIKGATALRVLLAAGLQPSFGFELPDAEALWGSMLWRYQNPLLVAAAEDWVSQVNNGNELPTIAEFAQHVQKIQRKLSGTTRSVANSPRCTECNGSGQSYPLGWDDEPAPERWTRSTHVRVWRRDENGCVPVLPCPACRPIAYGLAATGHMTNQHVMEGGCDECNPVFDWPGYLKGTRPKRTRSRSTS